MLTRGVFFQEVSEFLRVTVWLFLFTTLLLFRSYNTPMHLPVLCFFM